MNRVSQPSPAIIVAVLALVAALAGTAIAEPTANTAVSKKKTKKIANKQIDKRLPWGTDDIADGAVTSGKIAADAVTGGKIAADAVSPGKIQANAIGTGKFAHSIPAARVTNSAAEVTEDQVNKTLTFNQERYDTAAMHDNTTNNSRLTAPVNGIYAVTLEVSWLFNANGLRTIDLAKNGATEIAVDTTSPPPTGDQEITTQVSLQAGDFVVARAEQNSGGALSVAKANQYSPEFSMAWLAPGP